MGNSGPSEKVRTSSSSHRSRFMRLWLVVRSNRSTSSCSLCLEDRFKERLFSGRWTAVFSSSAYCQFSNLLLGDQRLPRTCFQADGRLFFQAQLIVSFQICFLEISVFRARVFRVVCSNITVKYTFLRVFLLVLLFLCLVLQ